MAIHPQREHAIRRCLEQGEPPVKVGAELGVATSTLRSWLRLARELAELKVLLDQADRAAGTASG